MRKIILAFCLTFAGCEYVHPNLSSAITNKELVEIKALLTKQTKP